VLEAANACRSWSRNEAMSRVPVHGRRRRRCAAAPCWALEAILTPTTHVIDVETGDDSPAGEARAWFGQRGRDDARKVPRRRVRPVPAGAQANGPKARRHDKSKLHAILRDMAWDA